MVNISYAITVFNELEEIQLLIEKLLLFKQENDEIVVVFDDKGSKDVWNYLISLGDKINLNQFLFKNDFSELKNFAKSLCSKDYIFFIDADEIPSATLLNNLSLILENNKLDLLGLSRINIVNGITQDDIVKWRWNVNENGYINYPDVQLRIMRNTPDISWINKVHEVPFGYKTISILPGDNFYLYHEKNVDKQRKQNEKYEQIN